MARITGEIIIDRQAGEVFDFVADQRNEPKYNPDLLRSDKVTDGPIGVGTRFAAVHTSVGHPVDMIVEVTGYDRPRRFASRTTMAWTEIRGELTFDAAGAGTRMRWAWDVQPKGLSRLLTPVVSIVGRRQEQAVWTGLKRHLEGLRAADNAPGQA
jgi:polyketide cyclase/dehydrase/lipid transport protein